MSAIPFTDRELMRAWRALAALSTPVADTPRTNPHRLLLFYAVECGLKVVWLRRQGRTLFNSEDIQQTSHNLRQLLKDLKVGGGLELPQSLQLSPVRQGGTNLPRTSDVGILHQAWRYGGECIAPTDQICEERLLKILVWIQGELK